MELYPLLQSQLGVFYDCMKYPQVMQYNIPCIVPLTDDLDLDRVEAALQTIFTARKELKTRFLIDENGEPRQYVDEAKKLTVVRREMSEADFQDYAHHGFCRPFDIMGDEPLIRAELVTVPEKNYLLVDIHHMVTDGTSYLTLFPQRDLPLAWEGKPLPVQEYGMLEAAADEYARLGDEEYQRAKSVMKEKYAGMDLATLSSRPENPVGEMGQESAYISRPMVDGWCQKHGFAPYQIFQAAFSYVLARILREDKVAYTTIYHGRRDPRVREAYGMFVRTIPFMMEIQKEQTVREYVASVHSEMKATLSQLAYPFSHFCSDLGVQPGISFNFTALPGWEEEYHFSDKHCPFVQHDRGGRPVRMYHTGDLCRWNEQGQIEYMGRIDTQVKLRGFRIELGEIESKALNINGIRQAAAEVRKVMGNEHLVLYYTVVEGSDIDDEALRAALAASSLAEYMVPDTYMRLDAMPMTPNGKINRKVLPMPELKRSIDYVTPEGETEQLFVRIFSEVLGIEQVGALDDFFEIGGTSLNAIKVIVEASKHGVQIVFNDLFNQKTPRALAALVKEKSEECDEIKAKSSEPSVKADDTATPADPQLSSINAQLKRNNLQAFLDGERQPVGDVLLTGATGYLGMHILNELLTTHDGHIFCPLRIHGGEDPMRRLKTMFFHYFGDNEALKRLDERVTPFAAEVTQPGALDTLDCQGLTVVNCVANVKHFSAGNDIELVNIESVRNLIAFCLRTGSRLIHISTTSIAGLSVDGVPGSDVKLTEQDLWLGQNIDANKYVYSKFKAEELVLDAIFNHGLDAKIMRVGNLSARQKDGEFQINFNTNNFLALLRAYVIIGMVPYDALSETFEFSPIDDVAHAIMLLATTPKDCTVFHPYNIHHPYFADILNGFADAGITLKHVERDEFQQALERMMDNPDLVTLLRPLMVYNLSSTHQMR